jgi:large subunit ribosomal protein L29
MKSKDLRALPLEDLETRLEETVKGLYQMRVRTATKELENTAQIRGTRRDVARLKQAIAEKRNVADSSATESAAK